MPEGIADLSYRHYSEGMGKASGAWKVICRDTMMRAFKNKAYWVLTAISGWYYMVILAFFYVMEQSLQSQLAGGRGGGMNPLKSVFDQIVWQERFYWGFNSAHLLLFITSLIVGTGVIANDNRANALLVYLSRPCTRGSYLFGKWLGVFIALLVASLLPALIFWIYGALNYRPYGFLSDDLWLPLKIVTVAVLNSALLTSLAVGASSLFRMPRLAGASLAGIYFVAYFTTLLFRGVYMTSQGMPEALKELAARFSYFSVNGLMQGFAKVVLDTNGGAQFGFGAIGGKNQGLSIPKPEIWIAFGLAGILIALCLGVAASRIKAVEVVK